MLRTLDDGGVELDFEPGMQKIPGTENHFDNLAELLPDDILDPIGSDMHSNYKITNHQEKIGKIVT